jgi:gamma-glutamyltranspeptidase
MYLPTRNHRVLIMGRNGAVGANHPLATQAGLDTLRAGGNAVDASVAISLTLGVVEPGMSGLGGDGFYQIYTARDATSRCYNATGAAPLAATPERFRARGIAVRRPLSVSMRGLLAGIVVMHAAHGRLSWRQLCALRSNMPAKALPSRITPGASPAMCARCSPPMRVRAACS